MLKMISFKIKKNKWKQNLLFPINEKNDWLDEEVFDRKNQKLQISDKPEVIYKVIGKSDTKVYKGNAKKIHKIYTERQIGPKTKTKYFLSTPKLKNLILDIQILRQ